MALKAKILMFNASPLYNADQGYYGGTTEAEQKHLVWHGNYAMYFEDAREEFGKKYDLDYLMMYDKGFFEPLVISYHYKSGYD